MNERNKILNKIKKEREEIKKEELFVNYKVIRNKIVNDLRVSKSVYFKTYFENHKKNMKKTWDGIRSIINIKQKNYSNISSINIENKCLYDDKEISEEFNKYFSTIGINLQSRIRNADTRFHQYLKNRNFNSLFLFPTDATEVEKWILKIEFNKSSGPFSIPPRILKLIIKEISSPIASIINLSFSTGSFPDILKISSVVPIHKKGSKLKVDNYRPISLLSNLSKIFEKIMYTRIYSFLCKYNCLSELQFGFRSKHSTNHALIKITDSIKEAIDKKEFACGVFIDLQKAFDTVNHEILLHKLDHYGIRSNAKLWFESFLTGRSQKVKINNEFSNIAHVNCGVPQGSILGPILFLIYINDLKEATKYSTVHHFADDTNLLFTQKSLKKLNRQVNHEMNLVCEWLRSNKISLNPSKTDILLFKSNKKKITRQMKFKVDGHKIDISKTTKYLGVIIDENLNWKEHINQLTIKLSHAIGMLSKMRYYVPESTLFSLYHALFASHMTYGCQVWFQAANTITKQVQLLQNKMLRIINFKNKFTHANNLYKSAKILKIADYVNMLNILFTYDSLKSKLPKTFENFVELKCQQNVTRDSKFDMLYVPNIRTRQYGTQSVKMRCINEWNKFQKGNKNTALTTIKREKLKELFKNSCFENYN